MVIVNARFLTQKVTGVQRFAIEICRVLKKLNPAIVFVSPHNIVDFELATELDAIVIGKRTGVLWEQIDLRKYLIDNSRPLLVNFCNSGLLFYGKQLVTIHDMSYKINPLWFSKKFYMWYNIVIPHVAKRSVRILTVSNSSKKDIVKYLRIAPGKIRVVYNASSLTPHPNKISAYTGDKYLLTISSLDPRKNLDTLIKAFKLIDHDVKLVIVGLKSNNFNVAFSEDITINKIEIKGYVTDEELVTLIKGAEAFVYISLYEGFGLPPLEAMQLGCPVVVSDISAHKETCGNAALYVNATDTMDVKNKIEHLLNDHLLRKELINAGTVNAARFSWNNSAQQVNTILNELV